MPELLLDPAVDRTFKAMTAGLEAEMAFVSVEAIPELSAVRQRAAVEAAGIMGRNREMLYGVDADSVPRPVDALGTAREVVRVKQQFGADSPEYRERFEGLMLDSERLLAEAVSTNGPEHFGKEEQKQVFDIATHDHLAHGMSTKKMHVSGLSPVLMGTEEGSRRVNDYVGHAARSALGAMIAKGDFEAIAEPLAERAANPEVARQEKPLFSVVHISECTDEAIEEHRLNPKGASKGYAARIKKYMVGVDHFMMNGDLYHEQLGAPGTEITHEDIVELFQDDLQVIGKDVNLDKNEVHNTQSISLEAVGAIDIQRMLDKKASQRTGKHIFMGQAVSEMPRVEDYEQFVEDATVRRKKLAPKPRELSEYLVKLTEEGTSSADAEVHIDNFLRETMFDIAHKNPDMAATIFDEETAAGFREVNQLRAEGRTAEAALLDERVRANAPELIFCGAGGSCGIEMAVLSAAQLNRAYELGLKGTNILHDTERACPTCNEMEVHYDDYGSKVCLNPDCGSTEIH